MTTRYNGLDGESYETSWNLNPFIYRDGRFTRRRSMGDLVKAVERLADRGEDGRQTIRGGDEASS